MTTADQPDPAASANDGPIAAADTDVRATAAPCATPADVVAFWREAGPTKWFRADEAFDAQCKARCEAAHLQAAAGRLDAWGDTADGTLALILLLDQIPRNVWRGTAHAFATDALARRWAEHALARNVDRDAGDLRAFCYMPFEHSEAMADQDRAVELFEALSRETGDDAAKEYLRYAVAHRDVITAFGRFPHRNAALGRGTTAEEQAWLDAGGGF